MLSATPDRPDWRDDGAYRHLLEVERAGHAWEWLRRDPGYRAACPAVWPRRVAGHHPVGRGASIDRVDPAAASWALHRFEDFRDDILVARPMWRAEDHALVLQGELGEADAGEDARAIGRLFDGARIVAGAAGDHVLLSDGWHSLRIDLAGRWLADRPKRLRWRIEGLADARIDVLLLRRLIALARKRRFVAALHPPHRHARRLILALRTHDALMSGASQQDIASCLLGGLPPARWRIEAPSLRSQAQRLVRTARALAAGGWRHLLSA